MKVTLRELRTYAKSLSGCPWALFIIFSYFLFYEAFDLISEREGSSGLFRLLHLILALFASPFFYSGLAVCLRQCLTAHNGNITIRYFLRKAPRYYLSCLFIRLLLYAATILLYMLIRLAGHFSGYGQETNVIWLLGQLLGGLSSVVQLFWISVLVVDGGKLWRSFGRGINLMFSSVVTAAIAMLWWAVTFASSWMSTTLSSQLNTKLFPVYALVQVVQVAFGYVCIQAIYIKYKTDCLGENLEAEVDQKAQRQTSVPDSLARKAYAFGWASVIPPLCLLALVLGITALRKGTQYRLSAWWGSVSGGLFTFFYCLLTVGLLLPHPDPDRTIDYQFLAARRPELQPVADKLNSHAYADAEAELPGLMKGMESPDWSYLCAQGIVRWAYADIDGARRLFYEAEKQEPLPSEFYSLYGRILLQAENTEKAEELFREALARDRNNETAQVGLALLQNTYELPKTQSYIAYALILLLLITLHEYGHAYTALKLGDDTAMQQGRVTLNPIAHIDLFGTIVLPAVLIASGSDFLFGWAKPVPVDKQKLRNPDKDHTLVSLAGPAANMLIAVAAFILMALLLLGVRILWPDAVSRGLAVPFSSTSSLVGTPIDRELLAAIDILRKILFTSVFLGIFNLIPIPPLDGSWILSAALKGRAKETYEKLRPYSILLFLGLVFTSALDYIMLIPAVAVWGFVTLAFGAIGFQ
jgi:Zn-dependent protease